MDDDSGYPRSAVRNVSRHRGDPPAPDHEGGVRRDLGSRARWLQDELVSEGAKAAGSLRDFAGAMAERLPMPDEDRDALARVLGVPCSLTARWVQDSVLLLRNAESLLASREGLSLLAARLEVIGWAWGEVPEAWSRAREDKVTRGWSAELNQRLTSP